jgi:hypothetical protein
MSAIAVTKRQTQMFDYVSNETYSELYENESHPVLLCSEMSQYEIPSEQERLTLYEIYILLLSN